MKKKLETLLRKHIKRKGLDEFLQAIEENGFYTAWASTSFHCNYEGGLLEHTINVIEYAIKLHKAFKSTVDLESVVLCSACHDIGKCYDYYVDNLLKSGNPSGSKPKKINPNLTIKNHALRSLMIVSKYFELSESERVCILAHDGHYQSENRDYMSNLDELLYLVHSADLYVARFVEPVKSYKKGE